MKKKSYLPRPDVDFRDWLNNFSTNISTYATKYGITPGEVSAIQAMALYFAYWMAQLLNIDGLKQGVTKFKNQLRNGLLGGPTSVEPTGLTFTGIPPTVPPGIESYIRSIVKRIKGHASYTEADGEALGILGDDQDIDLTTLKPFFTIKLNAGRPVIKWKKGVASAVKIMVSRFGTDEPTPPPPGGGPDVAWVFLGTDTIPDFEDKHPLPPFGQSQVWAYSLIYLINDEEVGEWSDIVRITVSGPTA